MPTNFLFLAETNLTPSIDEQRASCAVEEDVIVEAGKISFLDLPKKLAQSGHELRCGDRIKIYDFTCLPLNTATMVRQVAKLLDMGVTIEFCAPRIVMDPDANTESFRLLTALDSHWRRVHGMKTRPTHNKPGRKPRLTSDQLPAIKAKLAATDATYDSVSAELGIPRTTLYDYLKRHDALL